MDIKIKVDDRQIQGVIKALNDGFNDFKPLLKEISHVQLEGADETFKARGKNLGQPWERLKLATVKQKIRIGRNIDILQRSGKMRKSFMVSKITKNELEIENTVKYFKYHQIGTKNIPQRQMLGHSPEMIKKHEIATIKYVLNLIKKGMK